MSVTRHAKDPRAHRGGPAGHLRALRLCPARRPWLREGLAGRQGRQRHHQRDLDKAAAGWQRRHFISFAAFADSRRAPGS